MRSSLAQRQMGAKSRIFYSFHYVFVYFQKFLSNRNMIYYLYIYCISFSYEYRIHLIVLKLFIFSVCASTTTRRSFWPALHLELLESGLDCDFLKWSVEVYHDFRSCMIYIYI